MPDIAQEMRDGMWIQGLRLNRKRHFIIKQSPFTKVWYVCHAETEEVIFDRETKRECIALVRRLRAT